MEARRSCFRTPFPLCRSASPHKPRGVTSCCPRWRRCWSTPTGSWTTPS
ncbi:hypothetical protein E2C01_079934 [Portunus trituberculatus]|uniref:Uncharacterized protein n=1 Tax=Portunus trituberculatus TaxID=210409 RepID=A0A5B7II63_PORTR|nr:hypothetical protein [Portunus trituberculatus]